MDKFDKAILTLLQADANLPVAEIANRVALSKTACWHRIQKMETSGVIKARITLLDQAALNLPLTAFLVIRTNRHDLEWLEQFAKVVRNIPEIIELHRLSGDMDYLLKAVVTDMSGYDRLYKELIKGISLHDVSCSFVMETVKSTTQLPLDYI